MIRIVKLQRRVRLFLEKVRQASNYKQMCSDNVGDVEKCKVINLIKKLDSF